MAFRVNFELRSVPCLAVFTTNTPWKGERHGVTIEFLRTTAGEETSSSCTVNPQVVV